MGRIETPSSSGSPPAPYAALVTEIEVHGIAAGGRGVGRDDDGRVVFVRGALPGERVGVRIDREHKRHAEASTVRLVRPATGRRPEPCVHLMHGCGGCDLQHASPEVQLELKASIARDCLERIGRVVAPPVRIGGAVEPEGYRTTIRAAVEGGRAGFRAARSHDVVAAPTCLVAHPAVRSVLAGGRFPGASEVTVRTSVATGRTVAVVDPSAEGASAGDAAVYDPRQAASVGAIVERVSGHDFRVSSASFFQSGPQAATLLVDTVGAILADTTGTGTLVDLYAGVGLFAAIVPFDGRVVAIERSESAVADALVNLAHRDARVVRTDVERWSAVPADVVIADPSRHGLAARGVAVVAATGARDVVLVSCDPASSGRDAKLLMEAGYALRQAVVLDLFPQTSHVEIVSHFTRSEGKNRSPSP